MVLSSIGAARCCLSSVAAVFFSSPFFGWLQAFISTSERSIFKRFDDVIAGVDKSRCRRSFSLYAHPALLCYSTLLLLQVRATRADVTVSELFTVNRLFRLCLFVDWIARSLCTQYLNYAIFVQKCSFRLQTADEDTFLHPNQLKVRFCSYTVYAITDSQGYWYCLFSKM